MQTGASCKPNPHGLERRYRQTFHHTQASSMEAHMAADNTWQELLSTRFANWLMRDHSTSETDYGLWRVFTALSLRRHAECPNDDSHGLERERHEQI